MISGKEDDPLTNILTIDVEDWFMDKDITSWSLYESRIVPFTRRILKMLSIANAKATFFVLGYVAEHYRDLVKEIKEGGHEVATHGYSHKPLTKLGPAKFERDLVESKKILERLTREKVKGHRACQFTIMQDTSWAIDILKKNDFEYDSSVFPVKTPLYGVPNAPRFPYRISSKDVTKDCKEEGFWEFPLSVYTAPMISKNIPIAGGFYLRLLPYWFIKNTIQRLNIVNRQAIVYLHPWELDPCQPRIKGYKWYHYYRLESTEKKFKKLLEDFNFISISDYLNREGSLCS